MTGAGRTFLRVIPELLRKHALSSPFQGRFEQKYLKRILPGIGRDGGGAGGIDSGRRMEGVGCQDDTINALGGFA